MFSIGLDHPGSITTIKGDNKVPDALRQLTVGYSAGPSDDLATGLGSFDAAALVNNWHEP